MKNIPKTPYFILDKKILLDEVNKLKGVISTYWPNTIIAYSVKTNSLPYLAKMLHGLGVYAEVVSEDEYDMVELCGYTPDYVVCNGPIKTREFVTKLLENNAKINIDSHIELQHVLAYARENPMRQIGVGIRVNVDIEKYFPSESKAGEQGSRFGFCMENEELRDAIQILSQCSNVYISGLHLHVSTSTRKVEIYEWLAFLFSKLVKEYSLTRIKYFDIGGGFFGGMPDKPGWKEYISAIANVLSSHGYTSEGLTLVLEPGVSLLAGAFSYVASVVDVKQTNRSRFVVTDGSRIHIDPFFHKNKYFYNHLCSIPRELHKKQIIVGFTCLEYDNIMVLDNKPEVVVGDLFVFDKLGAYSITLSPLFISYYPAVYLKDEDNALVCVREKWNAREFVQKSLI